MYKCNNREIIDVRNKKVKKKLMWFINLLYFTMIKDDTRDMYIGMDTALWMVYVY